MLDEHLGADHVLARSARQAWYVEQFHLNCASLRLLSAAAGDSLRGRLGSRLCLKHDETATSRGQLLGLFGATPRAAIKLCSRSVCARRSHTLSNLGALMLQKRVGAAARVQRRVPTCGRLSELDSGRNGLRWHLLESRRLSCSARGKHVSRLHGLLLVRRLREHWLRLTVGCHECELILVEHGVL